jgi:hypothetical protein
MANDDDLTEVLETMERMDARGALITLEAEDVVAALHDLDADQREVLAAGLANDAEPFFQAVARASTWPELMAKLLIAQALDNAARWSRAVELADELGDAAPWWQIARALRAADAATPAETRFHDGASTWPEPEDP